jgi:hypothetical protein
LYEKNELESSKLIDAIRTESERKKVWKNKPSCPFFDLPQIKNYMSELLDFFLEEIIPHTKSPY